MGFIIYGQHPLLVTRTQVSNSAPMGPLIFTSLSDSNLTYLVPTYRKDYQKFFGAFYGKWNLTFMLVYYSINSLQKAIK